MTTETRCDGRTAQRAGSFGFEPVRCHQWKGLTTWTDHRGIERAGCSVHLAGLRRRYPVALPGRTAPKGTLGLGTPWTRNAFAPDDVVAVENAIPEGYRINVIAQNPYRFVVVGLRENGDQHPVELFRSTSTSDPVRTALAMCERLALEGAA